MDAAGADADLLRRLSQEHGKWDVFVEGRPAVLAEPMILSRADHDELARLTLALTDLVDRTAALCRGKPAYLDELAFSSADKAGFRAEDGPGRGEPHGVTRVDFLPAADGRWIACELNTDAPGGHCETDGLNRLVAEKHPHLRDPNRLGEAIVERVRVAATGEPKVGILTATGYAEDVQIAHYLRRVFTQAGIRCVIGSPENVGFLWDRAHLFGEPVDVLYRYFPAEWFGELVNRSRLLWAHRNRLFGMINGFSCLAGQSKNVFAFWRRHAAELTGPDNALVERHTPATAYYDPARLEEYLRDRRRLAVKRAWGRMGEHVLIGREYDDAEWADVLAESVAEPNEWTVQEFVPARTVEIGGRVWTPCVGVYRVGGRVSGFMTRLSAGPRTAYDALHAATLVQG
jgi:hypothetical protein